MSKGYLHPPMYFTKDFKLVKDQDLEDYKPPKMDDLFSDESMFDATTQQILDLEETIRTLKLQIKDLEHELYKFTKIESDIEEHLYNKMKKAIIEELEYGF